LMTAIFLLIVRVVGQKLLLSNDLSGPGF